VNESHHRRDDQPMSYSPKGGKMGRCRRLESLADVHAHHWVDAPPSSGLTMASFTSAHTDEVVSADYVKVSNTARSPREAHR
jgi:hypothetical protein